MASITSVVSPITNTTPRLTEAQQKLLESAPKKGSITSVANVAISNNSSRLTAAQQKLLESGRAKLSPLTPAMARRLVDLFESARK
jgi:hypothetical protein